MGDFGQLSVNTKKGEEFYSRFGFSKMSPSKRIQHKSIVEESNA
jgi:hypothetical protein